MDVQLRLPDIDLFDDLFSISWQLHPSIPSAEHCQVGVDP
jgi:hypothetical protein